MQIFQVQSKWTLALKIMLIVNSSMHCSHRNLFPGVCKWEQSGGTSAQLQAISITSKDKSLNAILPLHSLTARLSLLLVSGSTLFVLYPDDLLWDGQNCVSSSCCELNNPPLHHQDPSAPTTDRVTHLFPYYSKQ